MQSQSVDCVGQVKVEISVRDAQENVVINHQESPVINIQERARVNLGTIDGESGIQSFVQHKYIWRTPPSGNSEHK